MTGFSQLREKPVISFVTRSHDFGSVREEVGKVSTDFVFTNTGKAPLVIQQVTASCGCTTPTWTKQPVAPGGQGKIRVTYSATGRPGIFTKTITVANNSNENPVQLTIHGVVTPKPLSQSQLFPVDFGSVRLKSSLIPVGNIRKGETKSIVVPVFNSSDKNIILSLGSLPRHITADKQQIWLAPGKTELLKIKYSSALINDWGFRNDRIALIVKGDAAASKENWLTVAGFISEDFSKLTPAQKVSAPVAILLTKRVALGKTKSNGRLTGSFELRNAGKTTLFIRKVFSDCDCISAQLSQQGIAAGKSATIRFTLNAGKTIGHKIENVNLITNSPSATDLQLPVEWETTK
jgi:hypothetical protein